jgi:hypothetical protein
MDIAAIADAVPLYMKANEENRLPAFLDDFFERWFEDNPVDTASFIGDDKWTAREVKDYEDWLKDQKKKVSQ